jgi:hypothetical protein
LTPRELLDQLALACECSAIVTAYAVRVLNLDIFSARVHLIDDSFIDVFANTATGKTSYALIIAEKRVYGKDNTKMGWHVHPFGNAEEHQACEAISIEDFLSEVTALRFTSLQPQSD